MADEHHEALTPTIEDSKGQPIARAANVESEGLLETLRDHDRAVALAADEETTPAAEPNAPATAAPAPAAASAPTPAPATAPASAPAPTLATPAPTTVTYADAGVSTAEGARAVDAYRGAVQSTYRGEVVGDIGGFGGLFSIAAAKAMDDPLLVSGTDGVGTKLAIAQRLGRNDTVGIDLVAMCANDVLACGAEPLFFLDYLAIGQLHADAAATIVGGIAEGCRQAGCALIGGETAEHPGVMAPDDYDLSGFCVGLVDRPAMITADLVQEGDRLIGLASSGFHSNGYSLIRKVCTDGATDEELNEPRSELNGRSLAQALLAPTRIYVKPVRAALAACPGAIHGIAHITGGGITENLDRVLPAHLDALVQLGSWSVPPVISYVCALAHLPEAEALKTFNMGIGLVLVVDPAEVDAVTGALRAAGETPSEIGTVVAGSQTVRYEAPTA